MVCRLVKREKIVWLEDQLCHCKSRSLTTAEHCYLLVDVLALEEECSKYVSEFQADITHSDSVESTEDRVLLIEDILLILSVVADIHIVSDL